MCTHASTTLFSNDTTITAIDAWFNINAVTFHCKKSIRFHLKSKFMSNHLNLIFIKLFINLDQE